MRSCNIATYTRVWLCLVVIGILLFGCDGSINVSQRPQDVQIGDNLSEMFAVVIPDHFTIEIRDASNVEDLFTFEQPVYLPKITTCNDARLFYLQLSADSYFSQLKLMDLDRLKESQPIIITTAEYGDVYSYDVNGNGSKVAFLAFSDSVNEAKLYIAEYNVDKAEWRIKPLASPKMGIDTYVQLSLSDGGETLAFALGGKLYLFAGSDFSNQQILQRPYGVYDCYAVDGGVYYVSWVNGYHQIFYYDLTGKELRQITSDPTHKFSPTALLDGTLLYIDAGSRIDWYTLADYIILQGRNGGANYLYYSNEWGRLAWSETGFLEWLLVLYEKFGDEFYLKTFIAHVDAILQNTDTNRAVEDWQGLSEVGWSAIRYSLDKKTRYRCVVHSGLVGLPIAKFVSMVKENQVSEGCTEKAEEYLPILEHLIKAHEREWIDHSDDRLGITLPDEGYYIATAGSPVWSDGVNLPLNQEDEFGTLLLEMYKLTGNEEYLEKATKLGRILKRQLEWDEKDGTFHWPYWWGIGSEGWSETDAVSMNTPEYKGYHGAASSGYATMDLRFALELHDMGLIFDNDDVRRFIATQQNREGGQFQDQGIVLLSRYNRTLLDSSWSTQDFRRREGSWLSLSARYSLLEKTGIAARGWDVMYLAQDGIPREVINGVIDFAPLSAVKVLITARSKNGPFEKRSIEIHGQ